MNPEEVKVDGVTQETPEEVTPEVTPEPEVIPEITPEEVTPEVTPEPEVIPEPVKTFRGMKVVSEGTRVVNDQTFHTIAAEDGANYDLTSEEYDAEVKNA